MLTKRPCGALWSGRGNCEGWQRASRGDADPAGRTTLCNQNKNPNNESNSFPTDNRLRTDPGEISPLEGNDAGQDLRQHTPGKHAVTYTNTDREAVAETPRKSVHATRRADPPHRFTTSRPSATNQPSTIARFWG